MNESMPGMVPQEEQEQEALAALASLEVQNDAESDERPTWAEAVKNLGYESVTDVFENGKCKVCIKQGNDALKTPLGTEFFDRNDLRGILKHLDEKHDSLRE